jgi:hypothetical protein
MSTAIVRHEVHSIDDLQRVARMLAASNYFDAKATGGDTAIAQIATKILAGAEMGYGPFASVQGIHVIQGKPVISANLMAAAVKRSGRYDYRVRRLDNTGCELEFLQRNGDKWESVGKSTFTDADAKAAGLLGKDNWGKFPRNMFFARAMSNGIRFFCPDVFDGSAVYTPDELGADEDADGNVIDVQPTIIPQEVRPANKPAAPAPVAATISGGSQTSNGNGGGVAVERAVWQTWKAPADAYGWAMDVKACDNEFEAQNSMKKIVDAKFDGKFTKTNAADVYRAFYDRQQEKLNLAATVPSVQDAEPVAIPA